MSTRKPKPKAKAANKAAAVIVDLPLPAAEPKPVWTVTARFDERTPEGDPNPVNVLVSKLHCGGVLMMTLEGPTSEHSLRDLAMDYNRRGVTAQQHKKAFADLPEGARRRQAIKHNQLFCGPGFDAVPPPPQSKTSPQKPAP